MPSCSCLPIFDAHHQGGAVVGGPLGAVGDEVGGPLLGAVPGKFGKPLPEPVQATGAVFSAKRAL